jgi:hypothetical protein
MRGGLIMSIAERLIIFLGRLSRRSHSDCASANLNDGRPRSERLRRSDDSNLSLTVFKALRVAGIFIPEIQYTSIIYRIQGTRLARMYSSSLAHLSKGVSHMDYGRPPILFVAVWGLFAIAMLFAQSQIVANGGKLLNVVDIQDPEMHLQLAALD